jgi:hypothetical protein
LHNTNPLRALLHIQKGFLPDMFHIHTNRMTEVQTQKILMKFKLCISGNNYTKEYNLEGIISTHNAERTLDFR